MSAQLSYGQGSSIFFQRDEDPNIYSINPDGTNLTTVTEGRNPDWSPDGSSILVNRGGNMWTVSSDGRVSVQLVQAHDYAWSRNGQQIVLMRAEGIYLVNKDGTGERQLVAAGSVLPRWSPTDDSLVVYYRQRDSDVTDIFFVNVFSGESKLVRAVAYIPDIQHPFSPDGTRLLMSDCFDGSSCIKVLNLATGVLTQIGPSGRGGAQNPRWSPDGSRILFNTFDGTGGLYLADADGMATTQLIPGRDEAAPGSPVWSPRGDMIAFSMMDFVARTGQIHLINVDGTGMRLLTEGFPVSWPSSGLQGGTNIQMLPWGVLKSQ